MNSFRNRLENLLIDIFVKIVLRKIILPMILIFTYFIGIGLTSFFVKILRIKLANARPISKESYWLHAYGYEPDFESSCRQS